MKITVWNHVSCAHTALISFSLIAFELHASGLYLVWVIFAFTAVLLTRTSPWPRGKCVRFGAGRSRVRLSAGSYQDFVNWHCGLLTRRTVYGKSCRELTQNIKTSRVKMKPEIVRNSVVALQDHGSYKAPTQQTTISNKALLTCLFFRFVRYRSSRFKFIKTLTTGLRCHSLQFNKLKSNCRRVHG